MSYLAKVQRTLREAETVRRTNGAIAACAFLRRYLYSQSTMVLFESRNKNLVLPLPIGFEVVKVATADKAAHLQAIDEAGAGSDVSNFDRGAVAYLLTVGRTGVAIGWRFMSSPLFAPLGYDSRSTIYLGGYHVRNEHRGRGLYPYLVQRMFTDAESAQCAIAETAVGNVASQRGLAKAGFTQRGTVRRTTLCGSLIRCRLEAAQIQGAE